MLTNKQHLESFEVWCWRRMENISWTDHVRKEEVLLRVNEQRNILHEYVEIKCQLDATDEFLLQILLFAHSTKYDR
jgi:hypothetical protein